MTAAELFAIVQKTVTDLVHREDTERSKVVEVYRLLSHFLISLGEREQLHFSTLFARISYLTSKYAVDHRLTRLLHHFRLVSEGYLRKGTMPDDWTAREIWQNGAYTLLRVASDVLHTPLSAEAAALFPAEIPRQPPERERVEFFREARITATEIDAPRGILHGHVEGTGEQVQVDYRDPGRSELYAGNVTSAADLLGLPMTLSIVDCERDARGVVSPRIIVIEPDYLVDVTAVAECFSDTGSDSRLYLLSKFLPREVTVPILIGNMVNYFLDQLVQDPAVSFRQLISKTFNLNPIAFSALDDDEVHMMVKKAQSHFENLQRAVNRDFRELKIRPEESFIEPSFYAPTFGIQGRLDLYHPAGEGRADIIELKSARPYKQNTYGLSSSHYAQTLLYDLMIRAVHAFRVTPASYILYSSQVTNPTRYAPPVQSLQREVIKLRNEIFLLERRIKLDPDMSFIRRIIPANFPGKRGFVATNVERFGRVIQGLNSTEFAYFRLFAGFVAGEHYLSKVGVHGSDRVNGLASMWLDTLSEKEERFSIFNDLQVREIRDDQDDALVVLAKGQETNVLANFRVGDIGVLYPDTGERAAVLGSQIYKCSVVGLTASEITIRLRNKQVNYRHIESHERWVIEHDLIDSSFNTMHQGLFFLSECDARRRGLFLGLQAPRKPAPATDQAHHPTDRVISEILERIIAAPDYFLLWGPPGTGKTSVVLHHLARHYLDHTRERLLLLAYTNRAVDEICQALDAIGGDIRDRYLRIGSRYATGEKYRAQLLSMRIRSITKRQDLRTLLTRQRVIVATVSSIAGKPEILKLCRIETVIVDEASQILEPMLAGLLPRFRKWVLIGDHKQLPAVVMQDARETVVPSETCEAISLTDTRVSYFERMYSHCMRKGWSWALGALYRQGRMHHEIMRFASEVFYDGKLRALPTGDTFVRDLEAPMATDPGLVAQLRRPELASRRLLFVPSAGEVVPGWTKTQDHEARIVAELLQDLQVLHAPHPDVGIITPFRAQIANIRDHLLQAGLDPERYTIDTVERYQGSARDIVIMSLCISHPTQFSQIVSLAPDGTDRKLNVALTRAREQFVLVGNPEMIAHNPLYTRLVEASQLTGATL